MYIKELKAISPQNTISDSFFNEKPLEISGLKYKAIEPKYRDFIPIKQLRRMGKAVRMSIGAANDILKNNTIDAIIIGTAYGGVDDSFKFLSQIIKFDEGTLTPTNFVQSTPNAIAGVLAQISKCYGYNNTHANGGLSFEGALIDAKLLLAEKSVKSVLLGAVEEISEHNYNLEYLQGRFKEDENFLSSNLIHSTTKGSVNGEGASMFLVENTKENALAEIVDIYTICFPTETEIQESLDFFLQKNNIKYDDIDVLISGRNGDVTQNYAYDIIEANLKKSSIYTYKNLVGEYPTSTAFALWLACHIIQGKKMPKEVIMKNAKRKPKMILIYNQHKNKQHSFILVKE